MVSFMLVGVPGALTEMVVTDGSQSYAGLARHGYQHLACPERGEPGVSEDYLPIIHLVFSNLKTWINGTHHGVSPDHLHVGVFRNRWNRVNRRDGHGYRLAFWFAISRSRYQRAFSRSSTKHAGSFLPAREMYLIALPRQKFKLHASITLIAS